MPKNTTGGKHKGRKNGESNASIKNKKLVKSYLEDIQSDGDCQQVYIGRILSREGSGRYSVFFIGKHKETHKDVALTVNAPAKGSLKGKIRFETGSYVLLYETGLGGTQHEYEIIAMLSDAELRGIRKELADQELDDIDPRVLEKGVTDSDALKKPMELQTGGFVFEDDITENKEKKGDEPEHLTKPKSKSKRLDIVEEDVDVDDI